MGQSVDSVNSFVTVNCVVNETGNEKRGGIGLDVEEEVVSVDGSWWSWKEEGVDLDREGGERLITQSANDWVGNENTVTPGWCWDKVELCNKVISGGYPNAWGARIPVKSGWDLELLEQLLSDYADKEVVNWLRYGWPISRPPNWPDPIPTFNNHASAVRFPAEIEKYIGKEMV